MNGSNDSIPDLKSVQNVKPENGIKRYKMIRVLVLLAIIITLLIPSNVYAWCGCKNTGYPPQLDEQQGVRWVNSLPTARPYLARLWEVPRQVAEFYGARYKPLACGSGFYGSDTPSSVGVGAESSIVDRWELPNY
jgi:hypothetical protein